MQVKQISDNEIYLLIKYIKSVPWRVAKRVSYIEDARCLKVNTLYSLPRFVSFVWNGICFKCHMHSGNERFIQNVDCKSSEEEFI